MRNLSARSLPPALLAAAVLIAAWTAMQRTPAVPPFNPAGDQPVYDLHTAPELAMVEPIAHAPWRGQAPAVAAGLLAAVAALAGMLAAMAFGATPAAALAVVAATLLSAPLSATIGHAGPLALALLCVWTAWWLAASPAGESPPPAPLAAALVLIALGGWWSWAVLAGLPPIAALAVTASSRRARVRLAASVALSAVVAVALFVAHLAALATDAAAPAQLSIGVADVWSAIHDESPRPGRVAFVGPGLGSASTALGAALIVVGLTAAARLRAGLVVTIALGAALGFTYGDFRDELLRFVSWALAPVAAVGLTWLGEQVPPARRAWVTAALAVVLIAAGLTAADQRPASADLRLFAGRFDASLAAVRDLADGAPKAVVAEDTVVDSAVVAFGGGLHRMPQDVDAAVYAWATGTQVIAGPEGRRHLEALGLVFRRLHTIADPVRFEWAVVVDRHQCVAIREDRWSLLPGLEYTGRIGLQVPAGLSGELRLIVGDTLPVALRAERPDGSPAPIKVETLLNGPSVNTPPPDYWFDGGDPQDAPGEIAQATVAADPIADKVIAVHLGRRSPRVLARLSGYPAAARGRVCAAALGPDRLFAAGESADARVALNAAALFGAGWYGLEGTGAAAMRWGAADAVVLVPLERRGAVRVAIRAAPAAAGAELRLAVNGVEQAGVAMGPGPAEYAWDVPARAWVTGVNDLHFHVSRTVRPADLGAADRRVLGIALHALVLSRLDLGPAAPR